MASLRSGGPSSTTAAPRSSSSGPMSKPVSLRSISAAAPAGSSCRGCARASTSTAATSRRHDRALPRGGRPRRARRRICTCSRCMSSTCRAAIARSSSAARSVSAAGRERHGGGAAPHLRPARARRHVRRRQRGAVRAGDRVEVLAEEPRGQSCRGRGASRASVAAARTAPSTRCARASSRSIRSSSRRRTRCARGCGATASSLPRRSTGST